MQVSGYETLPDIAVGSVVAGKYRVERVLGVGGMGVVVAASHIHLCQAVAIKAMLPDLLVDSNAVSRFLREARTAAQLKGEHVVRVYDVGTFETGAPYLVMEYLEGRDLASWLEEHGPLSVDEAVDFVLQGCEAMAEAHRLGVIHRDLKPANLFVTQRPNGEPTIKVLDFGISKVTAGRLADSGATTRTNVNMGSPLYMAPEQMKSAKDVDARADIWSLGIILYELLAGRGQLPFSGRNLVEIAVQVQTQPPMPLRQLRPDVPVHLEAAIARCLEKDPASRFCDVGEFAIALGELGGPRALGAIERIRGILASSGDSEGAVPHAASPARCSPANVGTGRSPASSMPVSCTGKEVCASDRGAGNLRRTRLRVAAVVAVVIAAGAVSGLAAMVNSQSALRSASGRGEAEHAAPSVKQQDGGVFMVPASASATSATSEAERTVPAVNEQDGGTHAVTPSPSGASPVTSSQPIRPEPARRTKSPPVNPRKPSAGARDDCDPPYTIDAKGTRRFKMECL